MTTKTDDGASRRDFLKLASVAAPAAAAAAAVGGTAATATEAVTSENHMQDTAHTRAYIDSARF